MAVGHTNTFTEAFYTETSIPCYAGRELQNAERMWDLALSLGINRKRGHVGLYWIAKRPTAMGIPRRSPIQVLTQPNAA